MSFRDSVAEEARRLAEKAMGTVFWKIIPVRSGAISLTRVAITEASTGGNLAIEDVVMKVHATDGLNTAGANSTSTFRLVSDNAAGTTAIFADLVANLVTGRTVDLLTARNRLSVPLTANAGDTPNTPTILEKGKILYVSMLGSAGVHTGTVNVCVKFRRIDTDADIISKVLVA